MRNIRLRLAYDGTDYVGWQVQPNGQSVQACLETANLRHVHLVEIAVCTGVDHADDFRVG